MNLISPPWRGSPRKHVVKLLVKDRILGEPAKGERDGWWKRLERKPPLLVQPLISTAIATKGSHDTELLYTA